MKDRIMRIAMTLSMLIIPALVTGCGYSEKQIQQELSYQEPDQKELHEEYQYLAEVNEGDGVATGLINEYGECVVACMFDEITMGMTDEGFRILAYKSVSTDKQGESEAKWYYVLMREVRYWRSMEKESKKRAAAIMTERHCWKRWIIIRR